MFLGSRVRPVHRTDNLAAFCGPIVEASTAHNPTGLLHSNSFFFYNKEISYRVSDIKPRKVSDLKVEIRAGIAQSV
jgi:hypothetical protein